MTLSFTSLNQAQLATFAKCFSTLLKPGVVVCLHGPLGVGKTTFVQLVGQALGITEPMISPTFTLMKMYSLKQVTLLHIDAYRLPTNRRHDDVIDLLQHDTYAFIEWGENLNLDGFDVIDISLAYQTELTRQVHVTMLDEKSLQVLKECYDAHFGA